MKKAVLVLALTAAAVSATASETMDGVTVDLNYIATKSSVGSWGFKDDDRDTGLEIGLGYDLSKKISQLGHPSSELAR